MSNAAIADSSPHQTGKFARWWIAARPFSFPASLMPVVLGTLFALNAAGVSLKIGYFLLAAAGMLFLHAAANILNDIYDFKYGIDREILPVSGAVVRGLISAKQAMAAAVLLFSAGSAIGLFLSYQVGWPILLIGTIGLSVGILYSATAIGLKYRAWGDLAVLLNFGTLGSLGAWTIQTGSMSWLPVIWTLPLSFLIVAILHANNWRDIKRDSEQGCITVASMLGDARSEIYYFFLLFAPYALILALVIFSRVAGNQELLPFSCLITFLSLPIAYQLAAGSQARKNPDLLADFTSLDGKTAQLSLAFGTLYALAFIFNLIF